MIISKDKLIEVTIGSNQTATTEDFVNAVIQSRTNKPTTEINIDYYEELKAKADKWVEKETPYKPYCINKDFYEWSGNCKCGKTVSEIENYCRRCGQKLDWSE